METEIVFRLTVACVPLFSPVSNTDDVYRKTGFVCRNIQVIDTTDGLVDMHRDGRRTRVRLEDILKTLPERERLAGERKEQLDASRTAARADCCREWTKIVTPFGRYKKYNGQFVLAHDLAVNRDRSVYVVDEWGMRVQKFVSKH